MENTKIIVESDINADGRFKDGSRAAVLIDKMGSDYLTHADLSELSLSLFGSEINVPRILAHLLDQNRLKIKTVDTGQTFLTYFKVKKNVRNTRLRS